MKQEFYNHLRAELGAIDSAGLTKAERTIVSPQGAKIEVQGKEGHDSVLNFCANNYLGLADSPALIETAKAALDEDGYGMASVRFICGTQGIHHELESALSAFFGKEDSLLYVACFDANGGLFEPLFGPEDAIISDALNHASIIDGIRLCKAKRYRYANNDMEDLEVQLKAARADGARHIIIATTGCSPWMALSLTYAVFAIWRIVMGRWSWSMIATPPALWAKAGAARRSIAA